MLRLNPRILIS